MTRKVQVRDLGRMDYQQCWALQEEVFKGIVNVKIARRNAGLSATEVGPENDLGLALPRSEMIWVEHPHVLTLGKSGEESNVVASPEDLAKLGVQYFPINRGGDITYHGPGQLVGYPILDLDQFFTRHVLHSLTMARVLRPEPGARILDVGTGGGFPGIPLAILFPEAQFVLCDSIGKKIKVVQALAHGTRLDVRLPSLAQSDCQVWIDMAARPKEPQSTTQTS